MGQNECLAALEILGGIGTVADIAKLTNHPARFLNKLRQAGKIGMIESCAPTFGKPKIYYTLD